MIEQALYEHLKARPELSERLATYNKVPAVFNQEAPADTDPLWGKGPQYSRIVFAEDIQGDPERTMGGTLVVDIMCKDGDFPEDLEPLVRELIDGYFFSNSTFTRGATAFTMRRQGLLLALGSQRLNSTRSLTFIGSVMIWRMLVK